MTDKFPLRVLNDDGVYARQYTPPHAELDIAGPAISGPIIPGGRIVIPVVFDTLELAERAGHILADAFAQVEALA